MRRAIQYFSYPVVVGASGLALIALTTLGHAYWPTFPLIIITALVTVAVLERAVPDRTFPQSYIAQIAWPFARRRRDLRNREIRSSTIVA